MPREQLKEFRAVGGSVVIRAAESGTGGDGKPKLGTFEGNAYTGEPMTPGGWWGVIVVDLAGVKVPSQHRPVLRQHDDNRIVGHTTSVAVAGNEGIKIAGVFSGLPAQVADVVVPATNGFQWQLSIGAVPTRTEFLEAGESTEVNGREVHGPLTISRETELKEISFVPLGADGDTSVSVSASRGRATMFKAMLLAAKKNGNIRAGKYSDSDIDKMDEDEAKSALKKCMADDDKKADADDDADDKTDADDDEKKADADDDADKAKTEEEKKDEAKAAARRAVAATRKAIAAEEKRVANVRIKAKGHPTIIAKAIEEGWSVEKAELEALRASRPGVGVGGTHFHFATRPEISDAVLEAAVFQAAGDKFQLFDDDFYTKETVERGRISARDQRRIQGELKARYPDQVMQAAHTLFKGRVGLQQMLTALAGQNGFKGGETIRDNDDLSAVAHYAMLRADGASTSSIQNVLANVMNKMMLQGYMWTDPAWREVAGIGSVKDFKATKNINLFGDFEFKDVGPSGELQHATLQDQAFANQASTSGRLLSISRTHIINDDLGALTTVPAMMGRGGGLKLNKAFWTRFMNPGYDDGGSTNFFAATHTIANQLANSNYSSGGGSALSSAGLTAATLLFDNQVDPAGNPLGIDAEVMLYPPDLQTAALELMNSQFIVQSSGATTKQPSDNIWKGRYKPVKARYLNKSAYTGYSATAWYLLANPAVLPVIEIVFLNGQQFPTVQTAGPDFQFNVLGITMRAFFDIGVSMQNFRGGVKSAGA